MSSYLCSHLCKKLGMTAGTYDPSTGVGVRRGQRQVDSEGLVASQSSRNCNLLVQIDPLLKQ